ncbi:DUF5791 family protein [Natronosalvus vescus]|uniref:DUF5791 family protein n=1 Tax=Natronosalvus vescus TaxID=2953881 RepID=UPI002090BD9F|nr:DUF5791 family protein [Natronosalvus vescus]
MFYEQRLDVPDTPGALRAEYEADFRTILEAVSLETAADTLSVERQTVESLLESETPALTLEAAAEIQSLGDGEPDPETIVEMACEHLLLGMTTAVVDVDTLAGDLDLDLGAKEVQQKIERRAPMTFEEFVHIQFVIADRAR